MEDERGTRRILNLHSPQQRFSYTNMAPAVLDSGPGKVRRCVDFWARNCNRDVTFVTIGIFALNVGKTRRVGVSSTRPGRAREREQVHPLREGERDKV